MTSLVFRALDQHVVAGLADNPAIDDELGVMSYAQLLHESASVAGAILNLGVTAGAEVSLDIPAGRERIIALLACARVGAVPVETGGHYRFIAVPPVFHTPDTEVAWDLLIRAGRTDPAPAPEHDSEGYERLLLTQHAEVFEPLIAGRTI